MNFRRVSCLLNRPYFSRFLLIWAPLSLLLALIILSLYLANAATQKAQLFTDANQSIALGQKFSSTGLITVRSDLLFLADQAEATLELPPIARYTALQNMFKSFALHKGNYDQIRLLDLDGKEAIRINLNRGNPQVVKRELLQDKSHSYYRSSCMQLSKGEIYVSHLDLNIEHDKIELPFKPTIRFCTPLFSQNGRKQGLLIFNYLGQKLLDRILAATITASPDTQTWLLNSDGYWLMGGNPEDAWGFMFPERQQKRLEASDAEAWSLISKGARSSHFHSKSGLYAFVRLRPYELVNANSTDVIIDDEWYLISHIPESNLVAAYDKLAVHYWWIFVILEIVQSVFTMLIIHFSLRKKMAEALVNASELRYRSLLDSAPDAIIIVNQEGLIELVNDQTERLFGYRRAELLMRPVEMLIPKGMRHTHQNHRHNYFANPRVRPMGEGLELHAQRKDGSLFPIEISLSPLDTPNGKVATAIIRDITARRQAEQMHQESQKRYRNLMNNLPVGVYRNTPGPRGRFLEVNPALVTMLEAENAEYLMQHSMSDFYAAPDLRQQIASKLMQQGTINEEEIELVTAKGRHFWAAKTAVRKIDDLGNIYFDGVIEDISERKKIQQQLEQLNASLSKRSEELEAANHELEAFSYSVSHDLRAPLRAIDGFSQILQREYSQNLDAMGRNFLERIRKAAQHMGILIDDLLKLSRVTRAELIREEINLSEMVQLIMHDLDKHESGHEIKLQIPKDIIAYCDKRLMHIAMTNLLNNAIKFTGKQTVAEIEIGITHKDGSKIYFVKDNGAGFDSAYADKLFGVFQRLHETAEFPGTGIGLATVQRIIHKHGGNIWAESQVNQGATFYFTLVEDEQP